MDILAPHGAAQVSAGVKKMENDLIAFLDFIVCSFVAVMLIDELLPDWTTIQRACFKVAAVLWIGAIGA